MMVRMVHVFAISTFDNLAFAQTEGPGKPLRLGDRYLDNLNTTNVRPNDAEEVCISHSWWRLPKLVFLAEYYASCTSGSARTPIKLLKYLVRSEPHDEPPG